MKACFLFVFLQGVTTKAKSDGASVASPYKRLIQKLTFLWLFRAINARFESVAKQAAR